MARAAGFDLDANETRETLAKITGEGGTGAAKSSLRADLVHRRPTEVDHINGAIVRMGREYGVPTPINSVLVSIVLGLQSHYL